MHTGDQSKPEKEQGEYQEKYGETETNKTKFVKLQAPYFDTQKGFHLPVFTVLEKRIRGKKGLGGTVFWEIHSGVRESRVWGQLHNIGIAKD